MTDSAATAQNSADTRLVLVTGPSGAGRLTAINVRKDIGFEMIDNLPLRLLDGSAPIRQGFPRHRRRALS